MSKFTNPYGLEFESEPMNDVQAEIFLKCVFNEEALKEIQREDPEKAAAYKEEQEQALERFPLSQIILKRVKALDLPIRFTPHALMSVYCFGMTNPGSAVTFLIDCLGMFSGKEVNMDDIAKLYPFGFYSEKAFADYVDHYLKRKPKDACEPVSWAWIYGG